MGFSETTRGSLKLLRLWSTPSMFNDLWQILARQEYTNVGSKYMIGYSRHSSHLSIWGGGGRGYKIFSIFWFLFPVSISCFFCLFLSPVYISCFYFLFLFPVYISCFNLCFNFLFQLPVSISCLNFLFLFPVSIFCFNFLFQFPVSISCFFCLFKFPVSISCFYFCYVWS